MSIGLKIKALRIEKKWSQGFLGAKIGVSKTQISKYESGENVPPLDKINRMAELLGVNPEDLVKEGGIVKGNNEEKVNHTETATIPMETFLQMANDLRELNKELQERLKSEIEYEREIKDLALKINNLEHQIKKGA